MADAKIGRYEIQTELGRGGMATVYKAYDPHFERTVAVKVLPREFLHDPHFQARFKREATIIAALEHPAIVPVYDFDVGLEGQPYLVMRYMPGGSLEQRLEHGPLSLDEVCTILARLAPALDKAHAQKIIHRDLKPGNILFDAEGNPYIADFGIAKLSEATTTLTAGSIVGTPAYMSPEQGKGLPEIDGRSDVYALGAIVYQLLSGQLPYNSTTPHGMIMQHLVEPPPDVRRVRPDLPVEVEAVIRRAMAKAPEERYPTASAFVQALSAAVRAASKPPVEAQTTIVDESPFQPLPGATVADTPSRPSVAAPVRLDKPAPASVVDDTRSRPPAGAPVQLDKLAPPVARPASPVAQPPAPAARWSPAPQEKASPPSGLVFAGQLNAPAAPSRAVQPGAWLAIGGVVGLLALCGLAVLAVLAFRPGGWLTPKAITQVVVVVKTTAPAGVDLGTPMPVTETAADVIVTERPAVTLTPGLPVDTPLPTPSPMPTFTPEPTRVTRAGAWVDRVVFTAIEQADQAVAQLQSNDLDIYAYTVADPNLFRAVANDADLAYSRSLGSYTELSFNPSGPQFEDGRLNPFAVPAIREAVNWLIDRDYLAQEIYGGLARPRFLPTNTSFADYVRYIDVARELENYYAYDFNKASTTIATEMKKLGASQSAGKWRYGGNPVTLIFIIRTEDNRRQIGDYMANQLEAVGFTVDRQYKTRSEASPIWNRSDPRAGQWHIYTGGWVTTAISRDDGTNFGYFYTNLGSGSPLWQAYVNTSEFYDVAKKLWNNDFSSLAERDALFRTALRLCMQDSTRVWLVDQLSFSPHRAGLDVAYDLAGGIAGTQLWPFTLRFNDQEGGTVRIAQPGVLIDPWNPVGGSNWIYDTMPRRATEDYAIIADPYTGLSWPQRLERATVVAQTGLPIVQTLPWLDLSFQGQITVPTDAWADWDAANQRFITVGEAYGSNQTVKVKYTVYYPSDLFETVTWHDGSPLSMGDFILNMIMTFDRAKPESAIYDESAVPAYEAFTSVFKGLKIVSTDPLVIETYSDYYSLDAENSLYTWWPQYGYGQAPWHTVALGIRAEEAQLVTFSADKADALKETNGAIEWLSFISGPSLDILDAQLSTAAAQSYIPYKSVMGQYVSNSAAAARYKNLQTWYRTHGHFWIGTGPFYLDKTYPVEQTLTLARYPGYPDLADKWLRFGVPMIAEVELDGPSQVTIGAQASVDVFISFQGETYPTDQIDAVKYLLFDAQGALAATGAAELSDGRYVVTLPASLTAGLQAGAHRLEVAVTSKVVSIPTFTSFEFFTVP